MPNDFSIKYSGIKLQSMKRVIIKSSYPGTLKNCDVVWNVSITNSPALESLQRVSCFILEVEFFDKKAFCILSSLFTICFGTFFVSDWKTIFDIAIVLK